MAAYPNSTRERFMKKVQFEPMTGCLLWTGALTPQGYGRFWDGTRMRRAHLVAFELHKGPIPTGHFLDHVRARGCATRACCNWEHLEPVPPDINTARGDSPSAVHARQTLCKRGHDLTLARRTTRKDGRVFRQCRECIRERRVTQVVVEQAAAWIGENDAVHGT